MLTRLIVNLYVWIIEIALWLVLLTSSVTGYHYAVPALKAAGLVFENEAVGRIFGALFFPVVAFIWAAALIGPLVLLVDIRKSLRAIEARSIGSGDRVPLPAVQSEHYL